MTGPNDPHVPPEGEAAEPANPFDFETPEERAFSGALAKKREADEEESWAYRLVAVVVLFGAVAVESAAARQFLLARAAASWPTTQGVVLRSEWDEDAFGRARYSATVRYRYQVEGKWYESEKISPSAGRTRHKYQSDAESIVAKYPAGAQVQVSYNPAAAEEACLEARPDLWSYVGIVAPLLFVVGAGGYLLRSLGRRRRG